MYVDATTVGVTDRRAEAELVRAVREALASFEHHLQRIIVNVQPSGQDHVCRLRAWSERGQTVVVESCAASRRAAVATATDSLKRTLEQAPASRRWHPPLAPLAAAGPSSERAVASERSGVGSRAGASLRALSPASSAPEGSQEAAANASAEGAEPERATRVLLALHDLDPSAASVQWASVLVDALDAHLDVCRVLPDLPSTASLPPGRAWLDATRRALAATRETRLWCDQCLPDAALTDRVIPGGPDYAREAASLARQHEVDWIVVPAHDRCGATAAALARAAGCPVLVARPPTTRCTLLVATEVETDNYPALESAARLAMALHAPVLAFHDVQALPAERAATPQVDALAAPWALLQERLRRPAAQRPPEIDVLLAYSGDRVEGILQQARREDAEMVIVSLSPDSSTAHTDEVAARVADRALRSVLIVPVPAPANPGRTSEARDARSPSAGAPSSESRGLASTRRGELGARERRRSGAS